METIYSKTSNIADTGLFAKTCLEKGQHICPIMGKIMSKTAYRKLILREPNHWSQDYSLSYDKKRDIIPNYQTELGWALANHGCNPNAALADGKNEMYATRPIAKDEEITINYGWVRQERNSCNCGDQHCTGNVGLLISSIMMDEVSFDKEVLIKSFRAAVFNDQPFSVKHIFRVLRTHYSYLDREKFVGIPQLCQMAFGTMDTGHPQIKWLFDNELVEAA